MRADDMLTFATNQGTLGGGEVMLLHMAAAARDLGVRARIVTMADPDDLATAASGLGVETVVLDAHGRAAYARELRRWDRTDRTGLLWCNGFLPALATAGRRDRVVHLHRRPDGVQSLLRPVAVAGAREVIVPSRSLGQRVPHTRVLPNWTSAQAKAPARARRSRSIGFLGRISTDKGVDVLVEAVRMLAEHDDVRLVLGGDDRFAHGRRERALATALDGLGDRVSRLGWVDRSEFFARVDLAVFPSAWDEPFGLVVAEAMAAQVPFVVSDAGALPEVAGAEHPWIARAGDPADLARTIRSALDRSDLARQADLQRGRRRWEQLYAPEQGRRRMGEVLTELGFAVAAPAVARRRVVE